MFSFFQSGPKFAILMIVPLLMILVTAFQNCGGEAPSGQASTSSTFGSTPDPGTPTPGGPQIVVQTRTVGEGVAASINIEIQAAPISAYTLLWEILKEDGSPATVSDFSLVSGFIQVPSGLASAVINLTAVDDNLWEVPNRRYTLRIRESADRLPPASAALTVEQRQFVGNATSASNSSCAAADGVAKCWGANGTGQLGNGSTTGSNAPVLVALPANSIVHQIELGSSGFGCALLSTGAVYCWGAGGSGQLGNGATANRSLPGLVPGLETGVTQIAAGGSHACAIKAGGLYCWGLNSSGQLGMGNLVNRTAPTLIESLGNNVKAVAAGLSHTCAILMPNSSVKCWGLGTSGQLGNAATVTSQVPVDVVGATTGASYITAGDNHSCAVIDGGAKCWGANGSGQLGDNTVVAKSIATQVNGMAAASGVTRISAGLSYTCAIRNGSVYCWGINDNNQTGVGAVRIPTLVPTIGSGFLRVATALAGQQTCAIKPPKAIHCWGEGDSGQLGIGSSPASRAPNATPINF